MIQQIIDIITLEYRLIFRNREIVLILLLAPLIYATLYSLGYSKEVLYDVPVAIIDHSHSHDSRVLTQNLDASPYLTTAYSLTDIESAKRLLFERKIYAIVEIPEQFAAKHLDGHQNSIALYCDASYFLMYRQVFQGVMSVLSTHTSTHIATHTLFNPSLGYGSFIMPAILIVILQQTALMGIGIIGVSWRRRRLWQRYNPAVIVCAKTLTYSTLYIPLICYLFGVHYHIFGYPQLGTLSSLLAILVPYCLSYILLGITLSTLFRRSETPLLTIIWTSIPVLLISGASLPTEAFPRSLYIVGKLLPSGSAVEGFIRAQSMGAEIDDLLPQIATLWTLVLLYGGLSLYLTTKRASGRTTKFWTPTPPTVAGRHTLL